MINYHYFVYDLELTKISQILSLNRVTLNGIIQKIRHRIYKLSINSNPFFIGEIEVDESYFGAKEGEVQVEKPQYLAY